MLRWLSGRLLLKNFYKDLKLVRNDLGSNDVTEVCKQLLRDITQIKKAGQVSQAVELNVLSSVMQKAALWRVRPGRLARPSTKNIIANLLEDWAQSKVGAMEGHISESVFIQIDNEIWSLIGTTLKPQEVDAIQTEVISVARSKEPNKASNVSVSTA